MCCRKKIKSKIIHIAQAFCSVSANNGELVLSSSPNVLYMRHVALLFLAFSWDQSVASNHRKLASAQECFMGLCMFGWNMLLCALLCLCVCVSVCWGRRRGAGHSQRASCHFPNTMRILNAGSYVHVAVDIALSLSLTLKMVDIWNWTPPSPLCCHSCCTCSISCLCTGANNSVPNNLCCNRKTLTVRGIVLLGKKEVKNNEVRKTCSESDYSSKGQTH